jgi:hypothetical protein
VQWILKSSLGLYHNNVWPDFFMTYFLKRRRRAKQDLEKVIILKSHFFIKRKNKQNEFKIKGEKTYFFSRRNLFSHYPLRLPLPYIFCFILYFYDCFLQVGVPLNI